MMEASYERNRRTRTSSGRRPYSFRGAQQLEKLPHEERQVHPGARGDQVLLHHHFGIFELPTGALDIRGKGFVGGNRAAPDSIDSRQNQRAVAERGDGLLARYEVK